MNLEKINNSSLAKISFYKKPLNNFIKTLEFYNIVFARDGVYLVLKNKWGVTVEKLENIKYKNDNIDSLGFDSAIFPSLKKPKLEMFEQILEMFKYVCGKTKWELCINVYYNTETKKFELDIPNQKISSARAKYKYNKEFEFNDKYIRYLQIHSHNTMSARFSNIDDGDEKLNLCYFGVVGKITPTSKFYNVDMDFRIWNGVKFVRVDLETVFNIGHIPSKLSDQVISKLDKIIINSKEAETPINKTIKTLEGLTDYDFLNTIFQS